MSILDKIPKSEVQMSSLLETEDNKIVFSPREYNRCILIYYNLDNFGKSIIVPDFMLNEIRCRLTSFLETLKGKYQIGLCTEKEMIASGCFDNIIEETHLLTRNDLFHRKPIKDIIVVMFNLDEKDSIRTRTRQICNLYAILNKIVNDKERLVSLTYATVIDNQDIYKLCNDDPGFEQEAYNIMAGFTGVFNDLISRKVLINNLGDILSGDYGVTTSAKVIDRIMEELLNLTDIHINDTGVTLSVKSDVIIPNHLTNIKQTFTINKK